MTKIHASGPGCTRGDDCWFLHNPVLSKKDFLDMSVPKSKAPGAPPVKGAEAKKKGGGRGRSLTPDTAEKKKPIILHCFSFIKTGVCEFGGLPPQGTCKYQNHWNQMKYDAECKKLAASPEAKAKALAKQKAAAPALTLSEGATPGVTVEDVTSE